MYIYMCLSALYCLLSILFYAVVSQSAMYKDVLCHHSDAIYVASEGTVWRLSQTNIRTQVQQLLHTKQFDLALRIAVSYCCTLHILL